MFNPIGLCIVVTGDARHELARDRRKVAQSGAESSGNLHGERNPISHVGNVSALANYSPAVSASFCVRIALYGLEHAVFVGFRNSDAAMTCRV